MGRPELIKTFEGKTKPISMWAKEYGISVGLLHQRLKKGVDFKEALIRPFRCRTKRYEDPTKCETPAGYTNYKVYRIRHSCLEKG